MLVILIYLKKEILTIRNKKPSQIWGNNRQCYLKSKAISQKWVLHLNCYIKGHLRPFYVTLKNFETHRFWFTTKIWDRSLKLTGNFFKLNIYHNVKLVWSYFASHLNALRLILISYNCRNFNGEFETAQISFKTYIFEIKY